MLSLFRSSANPAYSTSSVQLLGSLICLECDTILEYYSSGSKDSPIFHPLVIGEDTVPTGAFLVAVYESLSSLKRQNFLDLENESSKQQRQDLISSCFSVLLHCRVKVLFTLGFKSPGMFSGLEDPRTTMAEIWFLALHALLVVQKGISSSPGHLVEVVGHSIILVMELIFNSFTEKDE